MFQKAHPADFGEWINPGSLFYLRFMDYVIITYRVKRYINLP